MRNGWILVLPGCGGFRPGVDGVGLRAVYCRFPVGEVGCLVQVLSLAVDWCSRGATARVVQSLEIDALADNVLIWRWLGGHLFLLFLADCHLGRSVCNMCLLILAGFHHDFILLLLRAVRDATHCRRWCLMQQDWCRLFVWLITCRLEVVWKTRRVIFIGTCLTALPLFSYGAGIKFPLDLLQAHLIGVPLRQRGPWLLFSSMLINHIIYQCSRLLATSVFRS